jgi:hypothetical protein
LDRPTTSENARRHWELAAERLVSAGGATSGKMMGMPTLYLGGKAFAGLSGDAMVFKLSGSDHAAALTLAGARLFDPSGMGRPMKAWVEVPLTHAADWPLLAESAAHGIADSSNG